LKIEAKILQDKDQQLFYKIKYAGELVLQNSTLRIIRGDGDFSTGIQLILRAPAQSLDKDHYNILTAKKLRLIIWQIKNNFCCQ
jgi:hypothetical protein